jgi:hypothetical protein
MPMSMSAADWTRMKRRTGGMNYDLTVGAGSTNFPKNKDISPPMPKQIQYGTALLISESVGGSKIRRPASEFTNFTASRVTDYVLKSQGQGGASENGLNTGSAKLTVTRLATCRGCASLGITLPKVGICNKCAATQHVRMN